jgi:hypothetical protein
VAWQNKVRSAAVPRLDVPSNILYTTQRIDPLDPTGTSDIDSYSLVAIDAATGAVLFTTPLGTGYLADTLQLSPTITPNGVLYQGTISGIDRVATTAGTLSTDEGSTAFTAFPLGRKTTVSATPTSATAPEPTSARSIPCTNAECAEVRSAGEWILFATDTAPKMLSRAAAAAAGGSPVVTRRAR